MACKTFEFLATKDGCFAGDVFFKRMPVIDVVFLKMRKFISFLGLELKILNLQSTAQKRLITIVQADVPKSRDSN